ISPDVAAGCLDLRRRSFAVQTRRAADKTRALGLILPPLALALFALAIAIAPRRRLAVTRCAVVLAVAGLAVFADLALLRHGTLSNLFGAEELSNADVRAAAGALWDSYLGDLSRWALGVAIFGAIVAAASASIVRPYAAAERARALRGRLWPPRTRWGQLAIGGAALLAGALLIGWPTLAIDVGVVLCGVALLYFGAGEVLSGLGPPPEHERFSVARSRIGLIAAAASLGILVGGVAIALATGGRSVSRPARVAQLTCNGYAQLCSRRVDQVVFPG